MTKRKKPDGRRGRPENPIVAMSNAALRLAAMMREHGYSIAAMPLAKQQQARRLADMAKIALAGSPMFDRLAREERGRPAEEGVSWQ